MARFLSRGDGSRWPSSASPSRINDDAERDPRRRSAFDRIACTPPTTAARRIASGACWSQADRVFKQFRTGFLGKASPVHFFWGSFDLAVTRFSGRRAPLHPGGVPDLPDAVAREAYSHEVSSAGFWPGGGAYHAGRVLFLCLPGAGGLRAAAPVRAGARVRRRRSASSSCLTTRCAARPTRMPCCSISCEHLCGGGRLRPAGTARRWNARWAFRRRYGGSDYPPLSACTMRTSSPGAKRVREIEDLLAVDEEADMCGRMRSCSSIMRKRRPG